MSARLPTSASARSNETPSPGIAWRLNAERLVVLGWSRAILLQLAHPLVAAGVAEHRSFRDGGLAAVSRLRQTVRAMLSLTFADTATRTATLARINQIHTRVHGTLPEQVGPFAAGTYYSAEDPALLTWVHCTLLESIPLVYERLVGPLTHLDRDQFCLDAAPTVRALGVTGPVPTSWHELQQQMAGYYGGGTIVVGATARTLASAVLAPLNGWGWPATRLNRLITVGTLPASLRRRYRLSWDDRDEQALERWSRLVRRTRQVMPDRMALWSGARKW